MPRSREAPSHPRILPTLGARTTALLWCPLSAAPGAACTTPPPLTMGPSSWRRTALQPSAAACLGPGVLLGPSQALLQVRCTTAPTRQAVVSPVRACVRSDRATHRRAGSRIAKAAATQCTCEPRSVLHNALSQSVPCGSRCPAVFVPGVCCLALARVARVLLCRRQMSRWEQTPSWLSCRLLAHL